MVQKAVLAGFMAMTIALSAMPALAAVSLQDLSSMEQQLFARNYNQENVDSRLSRLESTVFGAPKTGESPESRAEALSQFLNNKPVPAPSTADNNPNAPIQYRPPTPAKDAGESQYPTVTAMEQRVFNKSFEQDALETRLNRLEARVFNRPIQGSLQDRSDKLQQVVLGGPPPDPGDNQMSYGPSTPSPQNQQLMNANIAQALNDVENRVLRQTFPQDSVENRLSRLEQRVFNSTAPEMTPEDRLYRVASVLSAQQSARNSDPYSMYSRGPGSTSGFGYSTRTGPYTYSSPYGYNTSQSGYGNGYGYPRSYYPSRGAGVGMTLLQILMSFL